MEANYHVNHINRIRISFLKWYAQRAIYRSKRDKSGLSENIWLRTEEFTDFLKLRGESTAPFFKQINPLT